MRVKDAIELLQKVPQDWECFTGRRTRKTGEVNDRGYEQTENYTSFVVSGSHTFNEGIKVENIQHPLFDGFMQGQFPEGDPQMNEWNLESFEGCSVTEIQALSKVINQGARNWYIK